MSDAVTVASTTQLVVKNCTVDFRRLWWRSFRPWKDVSAEWDVCRQMKKKWKDASKDEPVWSEKAVECWHSPLQRCSLHLLLLLADSRLLTIPLYETHYWITDLKSTSWKQTNTLQMTQVQRCWPGCCQCQHVEDGKNERYKDDDTYICICWKKAVFSSHNLTSTVSAWQDVKISTLGR
jgi:hypothetical protein